MKTQIKNRFQTLILAAGFSLILTAQAAAQAFMNLHNFTARDSITNTNNDGANPTAGLIVAGNTLYGTVEYGGTNGFGTVFKANTNGTGFTTLYAFTGGDDGAIPQAGLTLSGNTLYGTTQNGGTNDYGAVFKISTNGTGFISLYSFTAPDANGNNSDGANPFAGLVLSGNTLYGTAQYGGTNGNGTVFKVNTNGASFTTLHNFTALDSATQTTNSDGATPTAGLILSGNTLYGTAQYGGTYGNGTVFKVNTNGIGFTTLYHFTGGNDGANPQAGLALSGNNLYGTAPYGGSSDGGTVFMINTNGTGFMPLYNFYGSYDGANPQAVLVLSGNMLYGVANSGGGFGNGTVFAVNTNGAGFKTLYSFTAGSIDSSGNFTNSDGVGPNAVILSGNILYGTAFDGGTNGNGTVFSLSTNFVANNQLFGHVLDASGNPIVGVYVYAYDGMMHLYSGTTDGSGYYSMSIGNGNWDIYVNCAELSALGFNCFSDQYTDIFGGSNEVDFAPCGPLHVLTTNLPNGLLNYSYNQYLQASNCNTSFTWSLNSGSLPSGLQLSPSGELSGSPTRSGTFNFSVSVTDGINSTNQSLSLTVISPIPVLFKPTLTAFGQFQLSLGGNVSNYYTVEFSTNLLDWFPLLIANPPNTQPMYLGFSTTNKVRYYRAYQSGIAVSQSVFSFGTSAVGTPIYYVNITNGVAVIPITRTNGLSTATCISFSTSDGTAVGYCDYTPTSGTLCFAAGVTSNSISIPVYLNCTTNQSATVNLHLSDTNGNNVLNALLVIQRPAPILAVFPDNLSLIVTPLSEPCSPAILTISNAGPIGSYLNYKLSVVNDGQGGFLTINGGDSSLGTGGVLKSGQSVTESFYVPAKYYYLLQPTKPAAFANMIIPLNIHTPDAANSTDFQVNLGLTNAFSLVLDKFGLWSGTCAAGYASGTWTLDITEAHPTDSGNMVCNGIFAWNTAVPYYNAQGQLRTIVFTITCGVSGLYVCSGFIFFISDSFTAPFDCAVPTWTLGAILQVDVSTESVVTNQSPLNYLQLSAPWQTSSSSGNYGGTGAFFNGSRQSP